MANQSYSLTIADISSATLKNCVISSYNGGFYALPEYKNTIENRVSTYIGKGTRVIAFPNAIQTDDQYIISVGYGNGFGVNVIDNAGTITEVYGDLNPDNAYPYAYSLGVDYVRKVAYTGNYVYDNIVRYDFDGDWTNTPTKTILTTAVNGLPSDEVGYSYIGGLHVVGDYLYISPDDTSSAGVMRWHTQTEVSENLTITSYIANNGRGSWFYDDVNDRLYNQCVYSYQGGLICVKDASTASPDPYAINIGLISSSGNYGRTNGIMFDEEDRNKFWCPAYYRNNKIDISDCLDDSLSGYTSTPTKILPVGTQTVYSSEYPWVIGSGYFRFAKDSSLDILWFLGDRGYGGSFAPGFVDPTSGLIAYIPLAATSIGDNNNFAASYCTEYKPLTSPDGSKFWVCGGYGYDGDKLSVWSNDTPPVLKEKWSFQTNEINMTNTPDITEVVLDVTIPYRQPPGTSGRFYVSNNNGTSWELYGNLGEKHIFKTTGYQFRLKFLGQGTESNSPFFTGVGFLYYLSSDKVSNNPNKEDGINFKLRGI